MTTPSDATQNFAKSPSDMESHQFVQRVAQLPMVALTLSRVAELYQQTKLRHEMLSYALDKGEQTVFASWDVATGIATKTGLQGPLNLADSSACYMLSKVEEKLPIITYTPDEIKSSTRRIYETNVQPRLDQLHQIKETTVQKYNDARDYGTTKFTEAKDFAVKAVVETPVQRVNQTVEWSLNQADSLMDKLLPDGSDVFPSAYDAKGGNLDHAKMTSNKLRQRIAARMADNVQTAQLLAQTFQIVDALKQSSAGVSIQHLLEEIRRLSSSMDIGEVSVSNIEHRTLALVKSLTTQLKEKLEGTSQQLAAYLPEPVQERLHQATDAARDIIHQVSQAGSINDLSTTLSGQVNGVVASVQTTMAQCLDLLTETYLIKWLIPEYGNIGSLDIHIHG